jgi:hypothetical protein
MPARNPGAIVGMNEGDSFMSFTLAKKQPPTRAQQKKDLHKLLIARSDIHAAHSACNLFLKTVKSLSDELYNPLFTAIVVCYARPFTDNKPYGALPKKWSQFEDPKHRELHDDLIKARRELVAHSDVSARKAKITPPGVVVGMLDGKEFRSAKIGVETTYYLFTIPRILDIPPLTAYLGQQLGDEIERVLDELYDGMELPNATFPLRMDNGL